MKRTPRLTNQEIQGALDQAGLLDLSGQRQAYPQWSRHKASAIKKPFLVTGDRQRKGSFRYGRFERVFQFIDSTTYAPVSQVRFLMWGSTASDLRDVLVYLNSSISNYLDRILVIDLDGQSQAGWCLRDFSQNANGTSFAHPIWTPRLPNLQHVP